MMPSRIVTSYVHHGVLLASPDRVMTNRCSVHRWPRSVASILVVLEYASEKGPLSVTLIVFVFYVHSSALAGTRCIRHPAFIRLGSNIVLFTYLLVLRLQNHPRHQSVFGQPRISGSNDGSCWLPKTLGNDNKIRSAGSCILPGRGTRTQEHKLQKIRPLVVAVVVDQIAFFCLLNELSNLTEVKIIRWERRFKFSSIN